MTCTVTIIGLWSHSDTGEEWADDSNALTAADAQAFKRACSCFGLGRYLCEFHGSCVDLEQNQQPKRRKVPQFPRVGKPEVVQKRTSRKLTGSVPISRHSTTFLAVLESAGLEFLCRLPISNPYSRVEPFQMSELP